MKSLLLTLLLTCSLLAQGQLLINEVAPNNALQFEDEDDTFSDWFEIFNNGPAAINLAGYAVSDDAEVWNMWLLPDINMSAGTRLILFASGKNRDCLGCAGTVNEMHTNFKLSAGETLFLFTPDGTLSDSVHIPALHAGHSYARLPDAGSWCYTNAPTHDATNAGACYTGYAAEPTFNTQPGFYDGSVNVVVSGGEVRYTNDGDWPDFGSILYTSPISVTANTVIKIVGIEPGKLPSRAVTGSFFVDEPTQLPVVSISSNSCDMFDEGPTCIAAYDGATGWEPDNPQIPAAVEYFTADKVQQFEKRIKFETAGNSSIYVYPQRGMQFTCDEDFGETSEFDFNIFAHDKPNLDTMSGFRVRANNDWGNSAARMKDLIHNRMALPTTLVVPGYQNVATFINGEYWGHYSAREELDGDFLRNNLGVDPDQVDIIRSGAGEDVWDVAESGTMDAFNELKTFFNTHNMEDPEDYAEAMMLVDKENWVDHFATQIYINNDEMPYNTRCFKSYSPNMKWKFILWDTGAGGEGETVYSIGPMLGYPYYTDQINMMNDLLDNPEFELYFINRYADLINYYFTWNRLEALINENADEIEEEIPAHYERWGTPTVASWNSGVNELKGFFDNRAFYQRNDINSYFDLGGQVSVTLAVAPEGAGYIKISTIVPEELPWTGIYFDDAPVQVTAIANPGYTFSYWDNNAFIADELVKNFTADISSNTTFYAHFAGTPIENPIVISEVNYNSDSTMNSGDWVELHNTADVDIDVSNYVLRTPIYYNKYAIPAGTIIPANGYLVLAEDTTQFFAQHPGVTDVVGPFVFHLENDGDSLILQNVIGETLVGFAFGDERPWPYTADGYGRTMEFLYPGMDPANPENWIAGCVGGSPGTGFTPCIENPLVDEINYKSSPLEDAGDWIELYNWSATFIEVSNWEVRDKNGSSFKIPFPTYITSGGGRLVIYQDSLKFFTQHPDVDDAVGPTGFGFDGNDDVVLLYDNTGQLRFSVGYDDAPPYPSSADGGGTALQLINASQNVNDPYNWTESCPEGSPELEFITPCANAIEEISEAPTLLIYPNPGTALFHISTGNWQGSADLIITDMTGKIILQSSVTSGTTFSVDMSPYPSGMYPVRVQGQEEVVMDILVKM